MKVFSNGKLLRTIPITTGEQPKFTTRSGIKVIIEKFDSKRMNSETVGIPVDSADGYDIDNVQWAMRVTYSGEFVHAAPWSVGSQGHANVSHGCTGMSTANADWLYPMTVRGDVVDYTGTDRPMEPDNGYGDWNIPWDEYKQGSRPRAELCPGPDGAAGLPRTAGCESRLPRRTRLGRTRRGQRHRPRPAGRRDSRSRPWVRRGGHAADARCSLRSTARQRAQAARP